MNHKIIQRLQWTCQLNILFLVQMCIRINNIHTLITIFTSLESHLHASTRTEVLKPTKHTNPFGYISSDPFDPGYRGATQQPRPNAHTSRQSTQQTHLVPGDLRGVTGENCEWSNCFVPVLIYLSCITNFLLQDKRIIEFI